MKKIIIIGAFALVVLGVIGFVGWGMQKSVPMASLNENEAYYTVTVEEPDRTTLADTGADRKARETIHGALEALVANFKRESGLDHLTAEDVQIQGLGEERKYALGAEYDVYAGKETVSYVYRIYVDTLGAHPNHFFRTFTFDRQGNELGLQDLFISNSEYLTRLSQEAFAGVNEEMSIRAGGELYPEMEETVRMGTAPSAETLQFYYLTETDLHLLFPPYQVAAYAAGSFDIAIPLSRIRDLLRPEYQ